MVTTMTMKVIETYCSMGSFTNIPEWARNAILAGAYQQGQADAYKDAFDKAMRNKT